MKATAKNIAKYVNESMDRHPSSNNISIGLPNLPKVTMDALKNNYGFKVVRREFLGYVHFER